MCNVVIRLKASKTLGTIYWMAPRHHFLRMTIYEDFIISVLWKSVTQILISIQTDLFLVYLYRLFELSLRINGHLCETTGCLKTHIFNSRDELLEISMLNGKRVTGSNPGIHSSCIY